MPEENKTLDILKKSLNRRKFVKGVGVAGLGVAGASLIASNLSSTLKGVLGPGFTCLTPSTVHAAPITDTDILNFALNLEYLEAEFYTVVTTGKTIAEIGIGVDGTGTPGPTTGGERVRFRGGEDDEEDDDDEERVVGKVGKIAREVALDEQHHVVLLRTALGADAIAKPAINLDALGFGFENLRQFLQLARAFEDVGVTAYAGAAPLITSKAILATAARIALTEALHAGNIRLLVAENNVQTTPLDSLDILPPPSGNQYFSVDATALVQVRTTSQVLAIVYGNSAAGTSSGGFFPNGVNGPINTV